MSASLIAAPYLEALSRGRITFQRCADCAKAQRLARYACSGCGSVNLQWLPASGTGTVFAITVVARAPDERFQALLPYGLALIDLDEGARLMGHAPIDLRIGERVRAAVFELGERRLLRFSRLLEQGGA
ncbi:MAG: OB-fold domain-containing protein [Quisquiliibacterium sp.]